LVRHLASEAESVIAVRFRTVACTPLIVKRTNGIARFVDVTLLSPL